MWEYIRTGIDMVVRVKDDSVLYVRIPLLKVYSDRSRQVEYQSFLVSYERGGTLPS